MKDEIQDIDEESLNKIGEKKPTEESNEILFIIFELTGEDYGLPVDSIVEIVKDVSTFNIPGSPEQVIGATDIRSEVIPIIDLKKIMGMGKTEEKVEEVLLVNVGEEKLALPVDRLKDIASSTEDRLIDPSSITNLRENMIKWIIRLEDGRTIRILDIKEIVEDKIGKVEIETE